MLIPIIVIGVFVLMTTVISLMFIFILKTQNKRIRDLENKLYSDNVLIEKLYATIVKVTNIMKRYKLMT